MRNTKRMGNTPSKSSAELRDNSHSRAWIIKLNRANELIKELNAEIETLFVVNPPKTVLEKIQEPDLYSVKLLEVPAIPHRWSALAGDIIHNLRSALDSIIFNIISSRAQEQNRSINLRKIYFPFYSNPEDLRNRTDWHQGVGTEDLFQAIEMHLPNYLDLGLSVEDLTSAAENHSLMILNRLSNEDKHKSSSVILCSLDYAGFALPAGVSVNEVVWQPYPWLKGGEIYKTRITGVTKTREPQLFSKFEVALEMDARPSDAIGIISRLTGLFQCVVGVTSQLQDFTH